MEISPSAQLEGAEGAAVATEVGEGAEAAESLICRFGNCFTAGTLIDTANGEKLIEDITVRDKVLAKDPETGKMAYKEVVPSLPPLSE
jgi:hypothetical protein